MNHRERAMAVLNYRDAVNSTAYDRLPVVHFGFWDDTLEKWEREGHITHEEKVLWRDGNAIDAREARAAIGRRLGFDYNWYTTFGANINLFPTFQPQVRARSVR